MKSYFIQLKLTLRDFNEKGSIAIPSGGCAIDTLGLHGNLTNPIDSAQHVFPPPPHNVDDLLLPIGLRQPVNLSSTDRKTEGRVFRSGSRAFKLLLQQDHWCSHEPCGQPWSSGSKPHSTCLADAALTGCNHGQYGQPCHICK